jgi:transposase
MIGPVLGRDRGYQRLDPDDVHDPRQIPAATGRPSYHPSVLLKLYIYGYLNRDRMA